MIQRISIAGYLFTHLRQLGVGAVHGVPGNYTLGALDHVAPAGLKWIGNCNELNASYAADGNAVAGSYAEYTPVVHIVGTPARKHQNSGAIVHHGLGDGRMRVFADMARRITAGQVNLIDAESAPDLVDGVLQECVRQSRPVYVEFPSDMVDAQISGLALDQPLDLMPPRNVVEQEDATVDLLLERMSLAKQPMILVDGVTARLDIANELSEFIQMTGFPTMALPFGGGVVDRSLKNYHGVHAGKFGKLDFTSYTDSADLVLLFGPLLSDTNTLGWSTVPDPRVTIAFHKSKIETESTSHELHIKSFMQRLLVRLRQSQVSFDKRPCPSLGSPRALSEALPPTNPSAPIDQDTFWLRISSFFRPHDTILLANGTPVVGGRDFVLPAQTKLINSGLWLSIGHMLPAAQGVALAQQELQAAVRASGRTILFEGDGSFQTTAQELSTIIRYWLDVTIFIIKNDRYTFERLIHGLDAEYNDIAPWRYLEAASFFGAPTDDSYKVETHRVSTWGEIETVLRSEEFQDGKGLKMVEIMMGKEDVTREFKAALRLAGQQLGPVAD